jgi:hypothetical protein
MPKFFGNFRIKSIELNKVRNYLLYAVGEIVLVAIGILLALQVSNWNEERNKEELRQGYYKNLLHDLTRDTVMIFERSAAWKKVLSEYESFKQYSKSQSNLDSLLAKADKLQVRANLFANFNNKTYETLLSASDIKLMNDSVNSLLKELNRMQVSYLKNQEYDVEATKFFILEEGKLYCEKAFSSLADEAKLLLNEGADKRKVLLLRDKRIFWSKRLYEACLNNSSKIKSMEIKLIKLIKQLQKE